MELNCTIGSTSCLRLIADILLVETAVVVSRKTKTVFGVLRRLGFVFWRWRAVSLHLWMRSMWRPSRTAGSFSAAPADIWFLVCTAEILELAVGRPGADKGLFFWRLWGGGARWRVLFWGNSECSVDVALTGWFCSLFVYSRLVIFNKCIVIS